MVKRGHQYIAAFIAVLYLGILVFGLHARSLRVFVGSTSSSQRDEWKPPGESSIPEGQIGESIRWGRQIFNDTALYAPRYTSAQVSCGSCHAAGGIQPTAVPMVGASNRFPRYSERAGRMIDLHDRIEECLVRSENGRPLPHDSPEMKALVDYIGWLSTPQPGSVPFRGSGLQLLAECNSDAKRGAKIYAEQCAGCHGRDGQGNPPIYPPLWGPFSFNDGAGMNNVQKLASFVQQNMPQNRMGILTPQEAFDIAAFIHRQERPHFNKAFAKF